MPLSNQPHVCLGHPLTAFSHMHEKHTSGAVKEGCMYTKTTIMQTKPRNTPHPCKHAHADKVWLPVSKVSVAVPHGEHVSFPMVSLYFPRAHWVHSPFDVIGLYPSKHKQFERLAEPITESALEGQESHADDEVEATAVLYFPEGQREHSSEPITDL